MSVRKRFNRWWVDFRFNGRRYRKASPDNTISGAKSYESHLRQQLARGEPIDKEEKEIIFKDFTANWFETYVKNNNKHSEIINKEMILRVHLVPHFGRLILDNIGTFHVEQYKAKKIQQGLCNKSINNHLAVLRKSLQCAVEWNLLKACPAIKKLKTPPTKFDFLTVEESKQLIASADGMWREMIIVALGTGLRFGELIALTWENIDLEKGELCVKQSFSKGILGSPKSNKIRYVPLAESVRDSLDRNKKSKGYVFSDINGDPPKQTPCINKLHSICRRAGLRAIGWHCLRHTFASYLVQAGANLVAIQGLLGHSEIQTTMRYAHINDTVLREAINILNVKSTNGNPEMLGHNMVTGTPFLSKNRGSIEGINNHISA